MSYQDFRKAELDQIMVTVGELQSALSALDWPDLAEPDPDEEDTALYFERVRINLNNALGRLIRRMNTGKM